MKIKISKENLENKKLKELKEIAIENEINLNSTIKSEIIDEIITNESKNSPNIIESKNSPNIIESKNSPNKTKIQAWCGDRLFYVEDDIETMAEKYMLSKEKIKKIIGTKHTHMELHFEYVECDENA